MAFSDKIQQVSECCPFLCFSFRREQCCHICFCQKTGEKRYILLKFFFLEVFSGVLGIFVVICTFLIILHIVFCSFCAIWNFYLRQRKGYCSGRTCLEGWSCLNVLGLIFNYFLILQLLYSPYLDVFAILYTLYTLYYLQLFPIKHSMTVLCFRCRCGQCWRSTTCNMCACPKRYILKKFFYLILRVCATISLILYTLTPFRLKRDYLVYFKYLCYSAFFSYFTDIVLGSFFWFKKLLF